MDITKAREIIRTLADGVDPTTGKILHEGSVYNSPEVIRALFILLDATSPAQAFLSDPLRNAGKPWTDAEDEKLHDEIMSRMKISDIAKEHGRTYGAIESRLDHLNLKKKPSWLFRLKQK